MTPATKPHSNPDATEGATDMTAYIDYTRLLIEVTLTSTRGPDAG